MKKYAIMRGLELGNKFFCMTFGKSEDQLIRLANGTVAYEVLGYADTMAEAQIMIYGVSFTKAED